MLPFLVVYEDNAHEENERRSRIFPCLVIAITFLVIFVPIPMPENPVCPLGQKWGVKHGDDYKTCHSHSYSQREHETVDEILEKPRIRHLHRNSHFDFGFKDSDEHAYERGNSQSFLKMKPESIHYL